jgi:uncharacterized membrane protein YbaN (DUF454 family)
MRLIWLLLGTASLGLGGLGVVLPLLPATPLVILAAFCFAKSSAVLHDRLIRSPTFGKAIRDWRGNRAISRSGKAASLFGMALSLVPTFALGAGAGEIAVQALALGGAAAFILACNTA